MASVNTPGPISWAPSQFWDGIDGNWSTFDLRVGSGEQMVRVLPSTAASATWVVIPRGCESGPGAPVSSGCSDSRGGLFNYNQSTTWNPLGLHSLNLEENLGKPEVGVYGTDKLTLGISNATDGPLVLRGGQTVQDQVIAGISTPRYWNSIIGLTAEPMHLKNLSNPRDSFLTSLKNTNQIPSLSWAYTAGAHYRSKGVLGSLTLGGSDTNRYTPNNVTFTRAPDVMRDIVVGVQSITSVFVNGSTSSLLPSPMLTFIDSTIPYIYLPVDACKMFEVTFGLTWNKTTNSYPIDEALHQDLLNTNPQFTFKIANDKVGTFTVDINLPYAAFDQFMTRPQVPEDTLYFPIRRAMNDTQLTLGRVFLQEAYLIMDYDSNNFTIAQATFNETDTPNLVPIPWNATMSDNAENNLSKGAIAGISIGTIIAAVVILLGLAFIFRKRLRRTIPQANEHTSEPLDDMSETKPPPFYATHEIDQKPPFLYARHEIGSSIPEKPQELQDAFLVELFDKSNPSGSGSLVKELTGSESLAKELFDKDSPSGSGNHPRELLDMNSPSGSGNRLCEIQAEPAHEISELPAPDEFERNQDSEMSESRATSTLLSAGVSTPVTSASTNTTFHPTLNSLRRGHTKTAISDHHSSHSTTSRSSSQKSSSQGSLNHLVNLNKALPQVPHHAYRPKGRSGSARAEMHLANQALTPDRPS